MGHTACTEPQCLYSIAIPLLPLWAIRPVQSLSACTVELYLYSPYGPYGLYRASVPVQGCTLPYFVLQPDGNLRCGLSHKWSQFGELSKLVQVLFHIHVKTTALILCRFFFPIFVIVQNHSALPTNRTMFPQRWRFHLLKLLFQECNFAAMFNSQHVNLQLSTHCRVYEYPQ